MPVHLSVRAFFAILLFLLLINEEWWILSSWSYLSRFLCFLLFKNFSLHEIFCWGWGYKKILVLFICVCVIQDFRFDVKLNVTPEIWYELFYLPFPAFLPPPHTPICFKNQYGALFIFHLISLVPDQNVWNSGVFRLGERTEAFSLQFAVTFSLGRAGWGTNWFYGVMYLEIKIKSWKSPNHELQTWTDSTRILNVQ